MKLLKISIFSFFICASSHILQAQIISLKKGEVLDILVLSAKPDTDKLFDIYKKTAFPVAFKMSYKALPGYRITNYTQGNLQPENFIFGKWGSISIREKFIDEIEKEVPDFHKQRQDIFSYFGLTYYEMQENTSFEIIPEKYNVVTAFWKTEKVSFKEFTEKWLHKSNEAGGKIIIKLTNGKSPFGYYYQPDYLVITQWESKTAFDVFYKKDMKMNHKGVKHVNQLIIN